MTRAWPLRVGAKGRGPGRPRKFRPGDMAVYLETGVGPDGPVTYYQAVVVYDWKLDSKGPHALGTYLTQRVGRPPLLYPHGPMVWRRSHLLFPVGETLGWKTLRAPSALREWRRQGSRRPEGKYWK